MPKIANERSDTRVLRECYSHLGTEYGVKWP
jgi:hypothetical protein